jgi:cytidine deaminase
LNDSEKSRWPDVERRRMLDRRDSNRRVGERRNDDAWEPLQLDEPASNEAALVEAAQQVRLNARAAYSGFKVGAALETSDGTIATGCNIENASYGLTLCAERVALVKALSDGHSEFTRIVVVTDTEAPTPPCGPCRQLLWEYCGDIEVVLSNMNGPTARLRLADLLPMPFDNRLLK